MTLIGVFLSAVLWPDAIGGRTEPAAVNRISTARPIEGSCMFLAESLARGMLFLYPCRVYASGHFEPAPLAAPVAAASFAVPLAHAFPFFAIGDDRIAFVDKFLKCRTGNAVNDGDHFGGPALRTCAGFFMGLF